MKKLMILLFLIPFFIGVNAQEKKYTIPVSQLTTEQLAKIEHAELQKKIEQYGNWVGVGGEVGTAVKEGLTAVVDVAEQFGSTDVGKFTIILVAWKVMGKDIVRIMLGLIYLCVFIWFIVRVYRNMFMPKRICLENPGLFQYPKKYQVIEPNEEWDGYIFVKVLFLFLFVGGFAITFAIMFA